MNVDLFDLERFVTVQDTYDSSPPLRLQSKSNYTLI